VDPALARVREEVADMQALADAEGAGFRIEPWDYRYYAEKVRKAKFDLDENELKPYLQLDQLREGMFWSAGKLFGLSFRPLAPDVPVYHPDVRVWEVTTRGSRGGVVLLRSLRPAGKRSGAWMSSYRAQERFAEAAHDPLVSNNCNFLKGAPGEIVLISWTDAETLFHEFGHALHGLLSDVSYPSLSGTRVPRDYVELPSQILRALAMDTGIAAVVSRGITRPANRCQPPGQRINAPHLSTRASPPPNTWPAG
jgi:peptidyl-dipeptidase Dcp